MLYPMNKIRYQFGKHIFYPEVEEFNNYNFLKGSTSYMLSPFFAFENLFNVDCRVSGIYFYSSRIRNLSSWKTLVGGRNSLNK